MAAPTTTNGPKSVPEAESSDLVGMLQAGWDKVSKMGQTISNAALSPQTQASLKNRFLKLAAEKPYLASFLLSQAIISGLPLAFSLALLATVGVCAVVIGVLMGVLGSLIFFLFATCVTVCCLLPTLLLTTCAAVAVWFWGAGALSLARYLNSGEPGSVAPPSKQIAPPNMARPAVASPPGPPGPRGPPQQAGQTRPMPGPRPMPPAAAPNGQHPVATGPPAPNTTQDAAPKPNLPGSPGAWKPTPISSNGAPPQNNISTPAPPPTTYPGPPPPSTQPPPPASSNPAPPPQRPRPSPAPAPPQPTQTQAPATTPAAGNPATNGDGEAPDRPRRDSNITRKPVSRPASPDRGPDQRAPSQVRRKPVSRPTTPTQETKPRSTSVASVTRKPVGGNANGAPRPAAPAGA